MCIDRMFGQLTQDSPAGLDAWTLVLAGLRLGKIGNRRPIGAWAMK